MQIIESLALLPSKYNTPQMAALIDAIGRYISGWDSVEGTSLTPGVLGAGHGYFYLASKDISNTLSMGGEPGYWAREVSEDRGYGTNRSKIFRALLTDVVLGNVYCAMRVANALAPGQDVPSDQEQARRIFERAWSLSGNQVKVDPVRWAECF